MGDVVQSVHQKVCESLHFTIADISCEFPQMSCTPLYMIITAEVSLAQVFSQYEFQNAHGCAQTAENVFGFCFL
jgi:hypothetical protein